MAITFHDKDEAIEYAKKMRMEGKIANIFHVAPNTFKVNMTSKRLTDKPVHITTKNLSRHTELQPHSEDRRNFAKVSFSPTIKKALQALPEEKYVIEEELEKEMNLDYDKEGNVIYYVYEPVEDSFLVHQAMEEDYSESKETASYTPVKARRLGSIVVTKSGKFGIPLEYKWIERD